VFFSYFLDEKMFSSSSAKVAEVAAAKSAFDFTVLDAKKQPYDLAQRRGFPTLVMNVASKCGLTKSGYEAATVLYDKYKDRGFTVLAFPCNQFASQEPGTEEEVQEFACSRFKANFPILAKVDVNGPSASPFWEYMKHARPGLLGTEGIKWNFSGFLIDGEGQVVKRYGPGPSVAEVEADLVKLLP
jgi:glutathione peroxidase-type tryparedoxin peroxidase